MTTPKNDLSAAKQDALRKANAARTRARHERLADELRDAGYDVRQPVEQTPQRWQLEVLFTDTGWTRVGDPVSHSELQFVRTKLEGLRIGTAPVMNEHTNYRLIAVQGA